MGEFRTGRPEHREAIDELLEPISRRRSPARRSGRRSAEALRRRRASRAIERVAEHHRPDRRRPIHAAAGRAPADPADTPLSTSPLDGFTNPIRAAIGPRALGLKNRQRTDQMFMLMQLHANRQDDVNAYVPTHPGPALRPTMVAPATPRRAVADRAGLPSLR